MTEGIVTITMELNDAFFSLEVEDPGPGFPATETLAQEKKEPLRRQRRRGIVQIAGIADSLAYSPKGNHVKAVLYRKAEGTGIFPHEREGIRYVEIKGKGDLALVELFKRWVASYDYATPARVCLMVRTEWVSSLFVGTITVLGSNLADAGSALSVWVEHQSCFRIMQNLGVTLLVHAYTSLGEAELTLRYADVKTPGPPASAAAKREREERDEEAEAASSDEGPTDQTATPRPRRRSTSRRRRGLLGWLKGLFKG